MKLALFAIALLLASPDAGTPVPKTVVDETSVLKPGEVLLWTLPTGSLHLIVNGVKHADHGFTVVAKAADRLEVATEAKAPNTERVKSVRKDFTVESQPFTLAIANTENHLERMHVYVKVTADP